MEEVTLIAKTQVDWPKLLGLSLEYLRFSISSKLDQSRIKIDSLRAYAMALAYFAGSNEEPHEILKRFPGPLNHIHFTVMVRMNPAHLLMFQTHSGGRIWTSVAQEGAMIMSGGLADWKQAIEDALNRDSILVSFCNKIIHIVDGMGLGEIWSTHRRVPYESGFLLEHKS
jgi:hypothetical protein